MTDINYLRIPLHKLLFVESLDNYEGLSSEEIRSLSKEYQAGEINGILEALGWAMNNPDHDFKSMLPGIEFSNSEVYSYLRLVFNQMSSKLNES